MTDGGWRYIRNLTPDVPVDRYTRRPAEELYDTAADRFELVNLAADPAARLTKHRLAAALDRWLASHEDR